MVMQQRPLPDQTSHCYFCFFDALQQCCNGRSFLKEEIEPGSVISKAHFISACSSSPLEIDL
jgi:hypothetical protein